MKVLVTGFRDWTKVDYIYEKLTAEAAKWESELPWNILIHGDCRGVDRIAGEWARKHGVQEVKCPANWDHYFKAAGPIRNSSMINLAPELVIAFHPDLNSSKGTADMVKKARAKNIPVEIFDGT